MLLVVGEGPRVLRSAPRLLRAGERVVPRAGGVVKSSDVDTGLLLAEGLGACARIAVEHRVSERAFLDLARSLYRSAGGVPMRGPAPAENEAWGPLVEALGGVSPLARELGVDPRVVRRWRAGVEPREEVRQEIRALARRRRVASPYP